MSTNGDYIRPLFPDITLADTDTVWVQRAIPVGPQGGYVRDALSHVYPNGAFADTDWVVVNTQQEAMGAPAVAATVDDQFSGTALGTGWAVLGGAPTVSGGKLHLPNTFPQTIIRANALFRLAGRTASVLGCVWPAGSGGGQVKSIGVKVQRTDYSVDQFQVYRAGAYLTTAGPSGVSALSFTYSATGHANLRIREAVGKVHWEASADGVTWTDLRPPVVSPTWVTAQDAWLQLWGGAYEAAGSDPATESTVDHVVVT
jgi:hypothetical protein